MVLMKNLQLVWRSYLLKKHPNELTNLPYQIVPQIRKAEQSHNYKLKHQFNKNEQRKIYFLHHLTIRDQIWQWHCTTNVIGLLTRRCNLHFLCSMINTLQLTVYYNHNQNLSMFKTNEQICTKAIKKFFNQLS